MSDNSTSSNNSTTLPDDNGDDSMGCAVGSSYNGSLGVRVAAIFIILVTSLFGTLFPIIARRYRRLNVPQAAFDFAKYFGSGVILATAFIHLLSPAFEELDAPCLTGTWTLYPWPAAIAMFAIVCLFIVEFFAMRLGMEKLAKLGIKVDPHIADPSQQHTAHEHRPMTLDEEQRAERHEILHGVDGKPYHSTIQPAPAPDGNGELVKRGVSDEKSSIIAVDDSAEALAAQANPVAQIVGVAILEFGVIFHSITIGLTLAVTDDFTTLFIVIIFHQMFEGLGLGSRLAYLPLPSHLNWVPIVGAVAYAFVTPLGLAIGLGVRTTYNDDSPTANIIQGVLDSISAGILLYTALVELLAHEFLFHDKMRQAPYPKVFFALSCVILGCGIMALLGRWA